MTPDVLFQLEEHVESGFESILTPLPAKIFRTRDTETATSPRIELQAFVGDVMEHQHVFPDGSWIRNGWNAKLETTIVTNRTDTENRTQAHRRLLGLTRSALQHYAAINAWNRNNPVLLVMIREAGTADSFTDQEDLDNTKLTWALLFNLNPNIVSVTMKSALN